jgi:hypothetical protein
MRQLTGPKSTMYAAVKDRAQCTGLYVSAQNVGTPAAPVDILRDRLSLRADAYLPRFLNHKLTLFD